jgi:hypothetical protein
MIQNIQQQNEFFLEGKLESTLFGKQIDVMIEVGTPMEYAQSCAKNFNELPEEAIATVCRRVKDYRDFMLEEWDEEFAEEIRAAVPDDVEGKGILDHVEAPCLVVNRPEGEGIGYSISGACAWEPEHGIDIIVKDDSLLYVGPQNCLGPWANESEYRVIF